VFFAQEVKFPQVHLEFLQNEANSSGVSVGKSLQS